MRTQHRKPNSAASRFWDPILSFAALALLLGCETALPDPPGRPGLGSRPAAVAVDPDAALDGVPRVLRLRVTPPRTLIERAQALRLFEGELSTYHVGRIEDDDLPATLVERLVPSVSWQDGEDLVIAPTAALADGALYSLASPELGLIAVLRVAGGLPLLTRLWPPLDGGRGLEHVIFCGDAGVPQQGIAVLLDPTEVPARLDPAASDSGVARESCIHVRPLGPVPLDVPLLPPPEVLGIALDPAPLLERAQPSPAPLSCSDGEQAFGPSCAEVRDDRLLLRPLNEPTLWLIRGPAGELMEPLVPGERLLVRDLAVASALSFELDVIDLGGRVISTRATVQTLPAEAHVVINEVLADALGAEPAQEWVELVNDGSAAVELEGFVLEDVGGISVLPEHSLEPGAIALVVGPDYSADSSWDVPPIPGTALLRVAALGKNGLSNSGEPLRLTRPDNVVVSTFPATPKPKAGKSVARRDPWSIDSDPASFVLHGAAGCSPGAPNEL
jgi:hypothetical protein